MAHFSYIVFCNRSGRRRLCGGLAYLLRYKGHPQYYTDLSQTHFTMKFVVSTALLPLLISNGVDAFTTTNVPRVAVPTAFSSRTQLQAEITMPALSSTMKEGRVVSWLKNEGDEIEAGEAIMVR